ncbi:hypothetical protein CLOLEP_02699 [[Clostridium] leptum DSM 753]|uniref:Uncharacterized protein n=1 Tax=[Clostridium] leptum DSM 753 TaxID=428125 RepID=A7VVT6_9FIRM|nr:hypothetical protein CLOLEP_02699 [[Clostridium] leptum DSM 753]
MRCKRPPEHPAAVAFDRFSKAAVRGSTGRWKAAGDSVETEAAKDF